MRARTNLAAFVFLFAVCASAQNFVWWEGESTADHNFPASDAFRPHNDEQRSKLSGGDWLQTDKSGGCAAKWNVEVQKKGKYNLWTRKFWKHGPFSWRFNQGKWTVCGRDVGLADSVDLRLHVCANWVYLGEAEMSAGKHVFEIKMDADATAAAFDCFLLIDGPFIPRGAMKPGDKYGTAPEGWFAFEPDADPFNKDSAIDLSFLNHKVAGERGFLKAEGDKFRFEKDKRNVRFWAVNAGPNIIDLDRVSIDSLAKNLSKRGVNMVRFHGPIFDKSSKDPSVVDKAFLDRLHYFVHAMKSNGIYTKLSFYFPLWFQIKPEYGFPGYDKIDNKIPFALLFFNERIQNIHKSWAKGLMASKNPYTGLAFANDPAVGIVEILNEDNYFFWTFKPYETIPGELMPELEKAFASWAEKKYGSLDKAFAAWSNAQVRGDAPNEKRAGLYSAAILTGADWAVAGRNAQRAEDTARFLTEHLRGFYKDIIGYLRKDLGVQALISANNWTTADQKVLAPLDKYANSIGDVMDRHGYFEVPIKKSRSWTMSVGDRYLDKSGLLDPFNLPVQEIRFQNKPHIISETNWVFPNRFRAEGVMFLSAYGALQGTDGFFLFALGSAGWQLQQNTGTVSSPATMGQFPAAALMYRAGYITEPEPVIIAAEQLDELYKLKGSSIAGGTLIDSVRQADAAGQMVQVERISGYDTLSTYVGPVEMKITDKPEKSSVKDLSVFIDRTAKTVKSITGELELDYGKGLLRINSPRVQGAVGFLGKAGRVKLDDCEIESPMEYGAIIVISFDNRPIKESNKIIVQVMSEETNYGWRTEPQMEKHQNKDVEMKKILSMGDYPIVVKKFEGKVLINRPDSADLKIQALDHNGYGIKQINPLKSSPFEFNLDQETLYYHIHR